MLAKDFFTDEMLASLRREIREDGFMPAPFLIDRMDLPVFGVNLACAYPFPNSIVPAYTQLAERLAQLDKGVYAYLSSQTHVTIMTLISFVRCQNPSPTALDHLMGLADELTGTLQPVFASKPHKSIDKFDLCFENPVLSRNGAIIPISNPTCEIAHIRRRVVECLRGNRDLAAHLDGLGLRSPQMIHSTIMRFRTAPADIESFLSAFDDVASRARLGVVPINQILVTLETKPYMLGGEILHRFSL